MTTGELQFTGIEEQTMESTRVMRVSGAAGVLAAVLILGGLYLATASGPGVAADGAALAAWAQKEEVAIETGVYGLLVPGLLLFLGTFAALAGLLSADAMWTRLAGYGALAFSVFFAVAGVLSSTSASSFGYYTAFEDPTAITVFTGGAAGYHLQAIGTWSLAMTMLATAIGLRSSGAISSRLVVGSIGLAALAVAASFFGAGVIPCLVWIVAVGIGLLRSAPSRRAAIDPIAEAVPS